LGTTVQARQLICAALFPPDVRKVLLDAFEDAWAELAPDLSSDPIVVDAARLSLAAIVVVDIATAATFDRDTIKNAAVQIFRSKHRIGTPDL
jgi:hypothetical protein